MRTYERTHPWLDFTLDVRDLDYRSWLLIGEAVSKTEHIAGVPLLPNQAQRLHEIYLAKGALATTAIEGNTLTEDEVLRHLEGTLVLPTSRQYLAKEIDNILKACNDIADGILQEGDGAITPDDIMRYNALVLRDLPLGEDVVPGKLRTHSVVVGRYRAAPAEDCEVLLERFCEWLNGLSFPDGLKSAYSVVAAIAAHVYFVWIHPFADGNGRTARLIEFRYLLQAGFPTPAAHLLSNFYNLTRTEYYRHLDEASSTGKMLKFIDYAALGLVEQLREQLTVIRNYQWDTAWHNFVFEQFKKHSEASAAHRRRRKLVIDLSGHGGDQGWVVTTDIPELTPRLAKEYADKTNKTLSRDLNALVKMGLITREGKKVRARKELIRAFLPARRG